MTRRPLSLLAALALCAACQKSDPATTVDFRHNKERKGTPVVTFGQDSITREEMEERFAEMSPFARARYQTIEQKKEYLEGLLRFELLAQEALARGMQNDPDVVETAKKVMVQKLIQKELDARGGPPSDAELAAYYEQHKADYQRPEMIRMFQIFLAAPADDASARKAKKQQAEALLARAKALDPMDFAAFGKLAREQSEEPRTKPLDGDMRYLSRAELETQYGQEVAATGAALAKVGDVSGVVETPNGFHILKLQGKQAALNLALSEVKPQLQSRLLYERRMQGHERFLEELKKKHGAKVDEAVLAQVKVDVNAPSTQERKGPVPGYVAPPANAPPSRTVAPPPTAPEPGGSRAAQQ
ncbi:MAG TPA: peptidyl-prolyl cis-trans isomerase [Myxococcaceae bacterium]|nr:peptidyl-prolyl cis-trans isomerase [Myxococcaceae bacterium]